jgi:OmcA/MtrC family decaheme c-type cytochrome
MGNQLVLQSYNFNANGGAQMFNTVGFPQMPSNCTKCHDGSATKSDGTVNANKTTDGDNWKNIPSMLACGACHDGIDFAKGTGVTLADRAKDLAAGVAVGTTRSGHAGLAKPDNSTCALCHDATTIPVSHRPNTATLNNPVAKAGVSTFVYDVKTVTRNATTGQPSIVFQIKKDGVAVTAFKPMLPLLTNAQTGAQVVSPAYEPIAGFASAPSLYVAYAVPQDGIAAPADFNAYQSVSLTNLLVPVGTSPNAGTLTGPDANGYWTATLTGDLVGQPVTATCKQNTGTSAITGNCVNPAPIVIPANAVMVTGAIIGSFTQKVSSDLTVPWAFPYTAANVLVNPNTSASGGLYRPAVLKKAVATGYTARRVITDASKCNACHDQLGTSPAFHGQTTSGQVVAGTGVRNDPTACNICHNNTRTSNGWIANSNTYIHGIHGASKRTQAYTWAGNSATDNFSMLGYPGILKDCNQCHLPNTVNFGATGGTTVQPNLMWPTGATGVAYTASNSFRNSPYITSGTNYGNGFSFTPAGAVVPTQTSSAIPPVVTAAHVAAAGGETVAADPATLVSSPIAAACFSCHDTQSAKNHIVTNGGAVYQPRATMATKGEACLVCHGAGTEFDAAVVHQ